MQLMIAIPAPAAVRLSEMFASIGFPDERGRAQRIATRFGVTRESVRKWLAGEALPETARLADMVRGSPYTVDYILTGRQRNAAQDPGGANEVMESSPVYQSAAQKLLSRFTLAVHAGQIDDRMIRIFNAMLDAILLPPK